MKLRFPRLSRRPRFHQHRFAFRERLARLERRFKEVIAIATLCVVVALFALTSSGQFLVRISSAWTYRTLKKVVGIPPSRAEIDAANQIHRDQSIAQSRIGLQYAYDHTTPDVRRLMDYAGMSPGTALLRWGNIDRTLLLSSRVFAPDDQGRSYRLRPNLRSIWVRNISLQGGVLGFFLVPEGPGLSAAVAGSGGVVVAGSTQTTNSWGCRGPEPDVEARLRGLIVGDSFMQALFIGDDQTPSACLERFLRNQFKTRVSLLNTGHLGYSPEQYYHTLVEYIDRFHPHFVVLSVFSNDFGDHMDVIERGTGDWEEARYWTDRIFQLCRTREVLAITVPIPAEKQLVGRRHSDSYPGRYAAVAQVKSPFHFYDPIDEFVDEHLRLATERIRRKDPATHSPLYNGHIADGHFSPEGAELWAQCVGRRLALLMERGSAPSPSNDRSAESRAGEYETRAR
jgi:hypothetical protein